MQPESCCQLLLPQGGSYHGLAPRLLPTILLVPSSIAILPPPAAGPAGGCHSSAGSHHVPMAVLRIPAGVPGQKHNLATSCVLTLALCCCCCDSGIRWGGHCLLSPRSATPFHLLPASPSDPSAHPPCPDLPACRAGGATWRSGVPAWLSLRPTSGSSASSCWPGGGSMQQGRWQQSARPDEHMFWWVACAILLVYSVSARRACKLEHACQMGSSGNKGSIRVDAAGWKGQHWWQQP